MTGLLERFRKEEDAKEAGEVQRRVRDWEVHILGVTAQNQTKEMCRIYHSLPPGPFKDKIADAILSKNKVQRSGQEKKHGCAYDAVLGELQIGADMYLRSAKEDRADGAGAHQKEEPRDLPLDRSSRCKDGGREATRERANERGDLGGANNGGKDGPLDHGSNRETGRAEVGFNGSSTADVESVEAPGGASLAAAGAYSPLPEPEMHAEARKDEVYRATTEITQLVKEEIEKNLKEKHLPKIEEILKENKEWSTIIREIIMLVESSTPSHSPQSAAAIRSREGPPTCFNCEKKGHIVKYCPYKAKKPRKKVANE